MSAIALLIACVIAAIAAGLHAVISGAWAWRSFVALFVAFLCLLILPGVVRP